MDQAGPSRIRRKQRTKKPLIITVPRGLLRRSLQEIIPEERLRVCFVVSGSEIKILTPSDMQQFDLSRVQHLPPAPSHYTGFRNLRSPSPPVRQTYEFPMVCPPEHGRYPPTALSPTYPISPFHGSPPNSIYIPLNKHLPQDRKVMSKLAKRRGVYIDPLTGRIKIVKRRTH